MLTIALCDDEPEQRSRIGAILQNYSAARPELAVKISTFASARELLAYLEEVDGYNIYVLDIVMPVMSGIDLGVRLQELGYRGAIIYLTVSPEYAVDSYAARAFHYLMKPVEPEMLFQVLDQAAAELEREKAACITVKTRDGLQLVRLDDLMVAELSRRTVRYHLANGTVLDSTTLRNSFQEEMAPILADSRFFLCGASFVSNLFYVTAVEKGYFRMDSGMRVPLARGLATQARERWREYWLHAPKGGFS